MKLNSKEQAWIDKRKKINIEHIKWGQKPELTFEERMKKAKAVDPYSEEGQKLQEESAKQHGRAWWIFHGMSFKHNRDDRTWIERYHKQERRPRKK